MNSLRVIAAPNGRHGDADGDTDEETQIPRCIPQGGRCESGQPPDGSILSGPVVYLYMCKYILLHSVTYRQSPGQRGSQVP